MAEDNSLEKVRLQKLEELRAEGIETYPTRAKRTHMSTEAIAGFEAKEKDGVEVKAILAGRIRAMRSMGKVSFAHIEDGAGKVQLFFRANEIGKDGLDFFNKMFDIGDFIQAEGIMFRTKSGEVTLHVHRFSLLAKSVSPLPAAKDETLEDGTVVRHAALDLRLQLLETLVERDRQLLAVVVQVDVAVDAGRETSTWLAAAASIPRARTLGPSAPRAGSRR